MAVIRMEWIFECLNVAAAHHAHCRFTVFTEKSRHQESACEAELLVKCFGMIVFGVHVLDGFFNHRSRPSFEGWV